MGMTLEEAIKHCEEVAEKYDTELNLINCGISNESCDNCLECAAEHRQLADWLRELRAYRKAEKEIEQELVNWDDIDNGKCRGLFLATSIIQHHKNEEVNADGDSN